MKEPALRGIDRKDTLGHRPARGAERPDYRAVKHAPTGRLVAETAGEISQDLAFAIARGRNRTDGPGHVVVDGRGNLI